MGILPLLRFYAAYAAGWALSPVVFALTLIVGETPRDTTGQRWLAELRSAQSRLREQSLRTIAISAATTASVTAAGSVAILGGSPAGAVPLTASAGVPASASVTASAALIDTPVLTSVPSGQSYTVQVGDTLWSIAARMGTTIDSLVAANHIADPNLIYAGQTLVIPGRVAVTVTASPAPSRQSCSPGATFSGGGGTVHRAGRRHAVVHRQPVRDHRLGSRRAQPPREPQPDLRRGGAAPRRG